MNEKTKSLLNIAIIVGILVFAYAAMNFTGSYSKSIQPSSFRSFSVSGEGKATAIPDVAQFTFSVITQGGKDIAGLQKDNANKTNSAINFVKSKGVDSKDIKTQTYNIEPRYQYYNCPHPESSVAPCPPPDIVGYTISQTIQVKIRDFGKIGEIISGVVESGANSVSQLSFTIDNPDSAQNNARTEAIQKAKEKAESVAKAGGFHLGRLLSIEEGGGYVPVQRFAEMGMVQKSTLAPTIEPGSQEINVTVTLKYEIE